MKNSELTPEFIRAAISGASILVVDDSPMNQHIIEEMLNNTGLKVTFADDGMGAIVLLDNQKFEAILMDTQMPGMDGFQATQIIRLMPGCESLPIIAVTASDKEDNREKYFSAGMTDYLVRSLDPADLYKVILKWVLPGNYN